MRVFTLLILLCPAHFLFAQNNLIASGTRYKSFSEAMYGREPEKEAPVAEIATGNAEADKVTTPVSVERTPLIEEKDTLSATKALSTVVENKVIAPEKTIVKKCVGMWNNNTSTENLNNCYALHRQAPIGSMIVLKNPMNGLSVQVKVIGKLPNNEKYSNVSVLVSAAAARQLHILDQKFIITQVIPESVLYGYK